MYWQPTICRACKSPDLVTVFDQGLHPLANDFCKPNEERAGFAPLKVLLCERCKLAQLSAIVRPDILYSKYNYVTSPGLTMKAHLAKLWLDLKAELGVKNPRIIEIGSNDGTFLDFLSLEAKSVLGIDPAHNLCDIAAKRGIETHCDFFGSNCGNTLANTQRPNLIIARHVFCHAPDWKDFVAGLEALATRETLIAIETPYVGDLLDNGEFDTIYHEHLSYLSIQSVVALLKDTGLYLHGIKRYPIHGGAVLLLIRHRDYRKDMNGSVDAMIAREDGSRQRWRRFNDRAAGMTSELSNAVCRLNADNKHVAALGASAKSTVWLKSCGFGRQQISWIADATPQKQGTTSPGSGIPIVPEEAILKEMPDYLVIFAWNYLAELKAKFAVYLERGGKFIVPVPNLEIIGAPVKTKPQCSCA